MNTLSSLDVGDSFRFKSGAIELLFKRGIKGIMPATVFTVMEIRQSDGALKIRSGFSDSPIHLARIQDYVIEKIVS